MTAIANHNVAVANEIKRQIGFWNWSACGGREPVAIDNGLMFRVTITSPRTLHKIRVVLDASDTYTVERVKINRKSLEVTVEESADGIYNDMLGDVIYRMCNK